MKLIKTLASVSFVFLLLGLVSGCAQADNPPQQPTQLQAVQDPKAKDKELLDNFTALLAKKDVTVTEVISYIDDNIGRVSPTGASIMVVGLEKIQKDKLPNLQDRFVDSQALQTSLSKRKGNGLTREAGNTLESKEARDLVLETQNGGYKIETAEGMFYPVIDYAAYKKYRSAATPDIAAYIDIMAEESGKTPVKDAAILISWNELLKRASNQEQFLSNYGQSVKVVEVQKLLKRYTVFALFGANNTPLFSYETHRIVPEAKEAYQMAAFNSNKGSFSKLMSDFVVVLNKNNDKLTPEVEEFRDKAVK